MKKFSNPLLFLTTGAIVALFVLVGFVFWQKEQEMPQVQTLPSSPPQAHSQPTPRPTPAPTVQPSADPTASWKTYRNEKYGFEVRYPSYWKLTDKIEYFELGFGKEVALFFIDANLNKERKTSCGYHEGCFPLIIRRIEPPPGKGNLKAWLSEYSQLLPRVLAEYQTTLQGHSVVIRRVESEMGVESRVAYISRESYIYTIEVTNTTIAASLDNVLVTILSGFKLIEKEKGK